MPGTGVQLALNVLHTGIFQALDGTLHALALFAHRVGITSQEQLAIPLIGHIESLNVSAAAAVMLFEVVRQRIGQ